MDVFTITIPSSSSSSSTWMDSRIWSRLPQRLLERVIAFLPPPAFFRSRCVCKRWYALLFSDSFLEMHLSLSPRLHWFIFFINKTPLPTAVYNNNNNLTTRANNDSTVACQGFILDPRDNTWYRHVFNLIPPGFSPVSSSGGLIAWVSDHAAEKNLILYNPLSRAIAQLPQTQRPRLYPTVGLAVGHSSLNVVVAGDDMISPFAVKNLTTECFHADAGGFFSMWDITCPLPRLCSLESGRMVFVSGKHYCMNYSPFSVLAYDGSANEWWKIQAPMRRFLRSPSLLECRGKLVLVAAVEKNKLNVPKSVRMWGLQSCGRTWVEVERMPQELYEQFAEAEGGRGFECVGNGDFIVMTICGSDAVLLFDFYRKGWNWVPPCPFAPGPGLRGFAYEPRLATPALGLLHPSSLSF
ncbi:protein UNUSUAL FLORAL ORGANS [Magnolia sinica]|uniref:protein UNUSUAL FLORAL ORGANS n=1 Tax=Magnolia sinica TaxID=86752 RepID=UPI002659A99B|nr:protein UNUSUAL FLORAL ORGANS [Magnolia sinica]